MSNRIHSQLNLCSTLEELDLILSVITNQADEKTKCDFLKDFMGVESNLRNELLSNEEAYLIARTEFLDGKWRMNI